MNLEQYPDKTMVLTFHLDRTMTKKGKSVLIKIIIKRVTQPSTWSVYNIETEFRQCFDIDVR